MSEVEDIDVYTQKLDPGIYVTLIGDESNGDSAKQDKYSQEQNAEPYVWVATSESLRNLLGIFNLKPVIFSNYIDEKKLIHFDFLYKQGGRSNCYMMVKTVYDLLLLDFDSDSKKITEIERGMKVRETKIKNVKLKEEDYEKLEGTFLSGLKINSVESISTNGEVEKLEFDELKHLVKGIEKENPMRDRNEFIQKILDGIAEDNSQKKIHDEAVKYMYG